MAEVHLPKTLLPLFAGLEPVVTADGATVRDALDALDGRWPGLMDRLCEPGPRLRRHIEVFVDRQPAELQTRCGPATASTSSPLSPGADAGTLQRTTDQPPLPFGGGDLWIAVGTWRHGRRCSPGGSSCGGAAQAAPPRGALDAYARLLARISGAS